MISRDNSSTDSRQVLTNGSSWGFERPCLILSDRCAERSRSKSERDEAGVLDLNTERHRVLMPRALAALSSWLGCSASGLEEPSSPRSVSMLLYVPCQSTILDTSLRPRPLRTTKAPLVVLVSLCP